MLDNRLNRRSLFRGVLAAGGGIAVAPLLAACGADEAETPSGSGAGSAATPTATATPEPTAESTVAGSEPAAATGDGVTVDELRIAMAALPPQLDPQTNGWIVMQRMYGLIYDTILTRDWAANGELAPGLAASWERIDDVTIELTLRDDVVFQDGTPMTAEDVRYTLDRTLQGDTNLGASGFFPIAEIEVVDDYTVKITTDGPDGAFEMRLSDTQASVVPAAYHQEIGYEAFKTQPIGTGPYKLVEYVTDNQIVFEAHQDYFGGAPAAGKVVVRTIPEVATRVGALLNDELDLILDLPPDQATIIEEAGGFTIDSVSPLNVNILAVSGGRAPTDNKLIRQALNISIDRQTIVDQLLGGHGLVPGSVQSTYDPLYVERPPIPYDPEAATALLEEAGYDGEEIQYVYDTPNYYPLQREWSEAMVAGWNSIGLNVTMHTIDVADRVNLTMEDPYHLVTTSSGVEVDLVMPNSYGNPDGYFQSKMFPPDYFSAFNETVQQARETIDNEERAALYQQALEVMNDEVMVIPQFTVNRLAAMKDTITWSGDPAWQVDLRRNKLQFS
jgi:peptide/nickel transport system substrate-binding protein